MSNFVSKPHDHFVRRMLEDNGIAKSFFQQYLPVHIQSTVNLDSLQLQKETFIDKELHAQAVDLLYTAKFGQQLGYLYTLVEHQSSSDRWMPFRLLKYIVGIMDWHVNTNNSQDLPIVYPLVLYANKKPYDQPTDLWSLFGEYKSLAESVLFKPFHLIDLSLYPDQKLKMQKDLQLQLFLRTLKNVWNDDFIPYLKEIRIDLVRMEKEGKIDYIETILQYFAVAGESKRKGEFFKLLKEGFSKETEVKVMTIAEQLRQEGRQEGIHLGHQEAIRKMEVAIKLLRQGQKVIQVSQVTHLPEREILSLKETLEKN